MSAITVPCVRFGSSEIPLTLATIDPIYSSPFSSA
jgi:hypothetical protein